VSLILCALTYLWNPRKHFLIHTS